MFIITNNVILNIIYNIIFYVTNCLAQMYTKMGVIE